MSWPGVYRDPSRIYYRRRRAAPRGATPGNFGAVAISVTPQPITITRQTVLAAITISVAPQAVTVTREVAVGAVAVTVAAQSITVSQPPSGVVPEPDYMIEVAFAVGAEVTGYLVVGDATRGLVGTGMVAPNGVGGVGGVWTDVTPYVRSWSVTRGSTQVDSPIPTFEPGTATIVLDNADRRFDPTDLDGPYVSAEATQITPMRAVRVRARWDDTVYELFRGFADRWDVAWMDPGDSETTLTAIDGFTVLQNNVRGATGAAGAGELTGARIDRILNSASWAAEDREIDAGTVTVQATTLDGDALSELRLVADTEVGELYVSGAGKVIFRDRAAVEADERSALPQAEFGDTYPELPYTELTVANDSTGFYNQVRATMVGGVEQVANDTSSQTTYLIRTFDRSDLVMDSDAQALAWASYLLARTATAPVRFDAVTIDPRVEPSALYPQVLSRELGDRITIIRRPPGGGRPITRDVWVRGITHQWSDDKGWESTQWALRAAHRTPSVLPARPGVSRVRRWVVLDRPRHHQRRPRPAVPVVWR